MANKDFSEGWKVWGDGKYLGKAKIDLTFNVNAFNKLFKPINKPYLCAIIYRFSKN
jgi:hypothetical protein